MEADLTAMQEGRIQTLVVRERIDAETNYDLEIISQKLNRVVDLRKKLRLGYMCVITKISNRLKYFDQKFGMQL